MYTGSQDIRLNSVERTLFKIRECCKLCAFTICHVCADIFRLSFDKLHFITTEMQ